MELEVQRRREENGTNQLALCRHEPWKNAIRIFETFHILPLKKSRIGEKVRGWKFGLLTRSDDDPLDIVSLLSLALQDLSSAEQNVLSVEIVVELCVLLVRYGNLQSKLVLTCDVHCVLE